ncbi:MAG: DUF4129 domain-containing protein [Halosimplex sp.]
MRDTTRTAIIAVLAVLAVAFAASTLDSTVVPERSGPSGPPGSGEGGNGGLVSPRPPGSTPGEAVQIPHLREILAVLAGIGVLAFVAYVILYWRETLGIVLAGVALLGLLFVLSRFLPPPATPPRPPMVLPRNGSLFGGGGGGGGGGGSDAPRPGPSSLVLLLVLGLALAGALVGLFRIGTDESDDGSGESDDGGASAAAVGRAAGRAADRIEDEADEEDVDNEVYRAWREMTDLLAVDDPGTSTPGEFAAAAVEAGLGREDVTELTRLFEDVRYGDRRPSDERERRAVAIFRRIEGRYAEEDS